MVFDHTNTGAGRTHDPLRILERVHKFLGRHARGFSVSRVESGLPAASLVYGAIHLDAQSLKNGQEGLSHFRVKTIYEALYK